MRCASEIMTVLKTVGLLLLQTSWLDHVAAAGTNPGFRLEDVCNKPLKADYREQFIFLFYQYNESLTAFKCSLKIWSYEGVLFHFHDLTFLKANNGCHKHDDNYIIVDLDDHPFAEDKCVTGDFASPYLYKKQGYLRLTLGVNLAATNNRLSTGDVAIDFRFEKANIVDLCGVNPVVLKSRSALPTPGFPRFSSEIRNCLNRLTAGSNQRIRIEVLDVVLPSSLSEDCACFVNFTGSQRRLCLNSSAIQSSFIIDSSVDISIPTASSGELSCAILLRVDVILSSTPPSGAIAYLTGPAKTSLPQPYLLAKVSRLSNSNAGWTADGLDTIQAANKLIGISTTLLLCIFIGITICWFRERRISKDAKAIGFQSKHLNSNHTTASNFKREHTESTRFFSADSPNDGSDSSLNTKVEPSGSASDDVDHSSETVELRHRPAQEGYYDLPESNSAQGSEYVATTQD